MAGGTGKIIHQMRTGSLIDAKTITGHATDQTLKGTAVELVATGTLPEDAQFVKLYVGNSQLVAADTAMLLDILVDSGGGDVVKIPDIGVGYIQSTFAANSTRKGVVWGLPILIPSGAQVLAQVATLADADTVQVAMDFYGGFPAAVGEPADSIDTLGADTATVKGVPLTTGLADAEPATWTTISASTPNAYKALAISLAADATTGNTSFLLDLGVGAAGFETPLVTDIYFNTDSNESIHIMDPGVYPLENALASGSRLSARLMSSAAANTDISLIVHGIK